MTSRETELPSTSNAIRPDSGRPIESMPSVSATACMKRAQTAAGHARTRPSRSAVSFQTHSPLGGPRLDAVVTEAVPGHVAYPHPYPSHPQKRITAYVTSRSKTLVTISPRVLARESTPLVAVSDAIRFICPTGPIRSRVCPSVGIDRKNNVKVFQSDT